MNVNPIDNSGKERVQPVKKIQKIEGLVDKPPHEDKQQKKPKAAVAAASEAVEKNSSERYSSKAPIERSKQEVLKALRELLGEETDKDKKRKISEAIQKLTEDGPPN